MIKENNLKIELKAKIKPEVLFKISRMKEIIKPSKPHRHDNYSEIIFLTEGEGYHSIDLQKYEVHPGSIFYLHPGQVHCWEFTKIPKGFVVIFKDDLFIQHNPFAGNFLSERTGINSYMKILDSKNELEELFVRIEKEYHENLPEKHKVICSYLQIVLVHLRRFSTYSSTELISPHKFLVQSFMEDLDKNFIKKKFVKDYAEALNISPKHLNEICKNEIGSTASKLIQDRILLEAKLLLLHTHKTAVEITYDLNFNDLSHFVKFFRKATGITPKDYRTSMFE